jgi:hypothetical protein
MDGRQSGGNRDARRRHERDRDADCEEDDDTALSMPLPANAAVRADAIRPPRCRCPRHLTRYTLQTRYTLDTLRLGERPADESHATFSGVTVREWDLKPRFQRARFGGVNPSSARVDGRNRTRVA